ncbi:hypothetical protein ACSBM8_06365 [Sphingomonas sp. ASY06-1R]|uniref:hypothetical protein n=1 Tax=Sphingomonas sp. ASY06-1R TaxID=3445771 RepID=UPI003FA20602
MKIFPAIAAASLATVALIAPASAQHGHTSTTVTRVHGPLKILPHHNKKVCKTRWVNHHRSRKCWYR